MRKQLNVIELMKSILEHWKTILVCVFIGALVMGVYSYIKSYSDIQATNELKMESALEPLSEVDRNAVEDVIADEKKYEQALTYMENSIFMKIDPDNVIKCELTYFVRADDVMLAHDIVTIYSDLLTSGKFYEALESQCDEPAGVMREIISIDNIVSTDTSVLRITILHSDKTECISIADYIDTYLKEQQKNVLENVGNHEIMLLSRSVVSTSIIELADLQQDYTNKVKSIRNAIVTVKSGFTKEQEAYYSSIVKEDFENEDIIEEFVEPKPDVNIRYIIFGVIIAPLLYVAVAVLKYTFATKIHYGDDTMGNFGIRQLGRISMKEDVKNKSWIEKWLDSERHRHFYTLTEYIDILTAHIYRYSEEHDVDKICLVIMESENRIEVIERQLMNNLEKHGIDVSVIINQHWDAKSLRKITDETGIVIIAVAGITLMRDIQWQIEILRQWDANIIGMVTVEPRVS